MRDRLLYEALRQLTDDAARLLEGRLREGAEIPFEVGEAGAPQPERDGGTALFAYKPLTAEFVTSHAEHLRSLPAFENAANNLARTRGTVAYLRLRGEPVLDVGELTHARLGVLAFLSAVWSDAEHFEPWEPRFVSAYNELESVVLAERIVTTVFIPVHGVVLDCDVVNLGAGVELMATEDLDADCLDRFSEAAEGADCYCVVSVDAPSDAPAPMAAVRRQARSLLTALRMFKPGSVSLGMSAQANVGGAWQQVAMPFTGRSREEAWRLLPGEDEELRQFIGAVRRVERRTRVAWALKRFEMGLERGVPAEGLTDFLAALRALLEAHDDSGKAALPARVAALCARDTERAHVRAVVEAAFALERLAVDGHVGRADRKRLSKQPPLEVIAETERCLRALLHDLVCGYLATDLKKLADEILLADGEPTGSETAAHEPAYLEPVPDPDAPPTPDPTATREFDAVFDDTVEITAVDMREQAMEDVAVELETSGADLVGGAELGVDGAANDVAEFEIGAAEIETVGEVGGDFNDGAPDDAIDNVWTLRPASEIKPAPELAPEPALEPRAATERRADSELGVEFESTRIPTYAEHDTDTRMRQLAEELVSEFDDALSRTMEHDVDSRRDPAEDRVAALFEPTPEFTPASRAESRRDHESPHADAERAESNRADVTERPGTLRGGGAEASDSGGAGFTFDFKVVEPDAAGTRPKRALVVTRNEGAPARSEADRERRVPDVLADAVPDPEFTVPEFNPPAGRGPAARSVDEVDAGRQRESFNQIMDENFTPPARNFYERPSTPVARAGRPHLVAIDGESARSGSFDAGESVGGGVSREAPLRRGSLGPDHDRTGSSEDPRQTVEFDVLADPADDEFGGLVLVEPAQADVVAEASQPDPERSDLRSEAARTHAIGPATIEFRPLVDPDTDDPDDFAGAC